MESLTSSNKRAKAEIFRFLEQGDVFYSINYSPSEEGLLVCDWALVETECLDMGHQISVRPEIPTESYFFDKWGTIAIHCTMDL